MIDSLTREHLMNGAGRPRAGAGLCHEALLYRGEEDFLAGVLPFVREGLRCGEDVVVAVGEGRTEPLRQALGGDAERVRFLQPHEIGRNPARLIPAWQKLLDESAEQGRSIRGVSEAATARRSRAELEECLRVDALLDEAFAQGPAWRLLCPYDLAGLDPVTIGHARANHPTLRRDGDLRPNEAFGQGRQAPGPFEGELPAPPSEREELEIDAGGLGEIRHLVAARGSRAGLSETSREDLVLAVNELVTNSVQHGGGTGTLRIWREPGALVCETRDRGFIRNPLAGRVQPPIEQYGGRGLWLVNHLCDLVQIRSSPAGSSVRVHMRTDRQPCPA
jgi:anti-sigma regulatory factor (Ser/Thr protein kinase)